MKKILYSIILLFFFIIGIFAQNNQYDFSEFNNPLTNFIIQIEQYDKLIPIINNTATLKKDEFIIIIIFKEPGAVLLNSSFNPTSYNQAINNEKLDNILGFNQTGIAEYNFNPDNEIFINDITPSYWHFDNLQNHRFN